jgi:hypothetical protein
VHYLNSMNHFEGVYTGMGIGATAGEGKGASTFENTKGVVISVKSKSQGLALSLGINSFSVSLTK